MAVLSEIKETLANINRNVHGLSMATIVYSSIINIVHLHPGPIVYNS